MIEAFRPSFSGHQSFPFRYVWPKKAIDGLSKDPAVFGSEDAMVRFGVGKNMVASMRHWSLALGLVEEPQVPKNRGRLLQATALGKSLFGDKGWDQYLEDPGTLWLLHWQLTSRPEAATTWWSAFNQYPGTQFTRRELQGHLEMQASQNNWKRLSAASLKRDIDVFIRTYAARRAAEVQEDSLDCPLVELGLVRESSETESFQLVRAEHETLPIEIFGYGLSEYLKRRGRESLAVTLEELAFEAGAPGRVFCLNERGLLLRLEQIQALSQGALVFDETAGLKQVYVHKLPDAAGFLETYYKARRRKGAA